MIIYYIYIMFFHALSFRSRLWPCVSNGNSCASSCSCRASRIAGASGSGGLKAAGGGHPTQVLRYRWPSLCEGWALGLANFVTARLVTMEDSLLLHQLIEAGKGR